MHAGLVVGCVMHEATRSAAPCTKLTQNLFYGFITSLKY